MNALKTTRSIWQLAMKLISVDYDLIQYIDRPNKTGAGSV